MLIWGIMATDLVCGGKGKREVPFLVSFLLTLVIALLFQHAARAQSS